VYYRSSQFSFCEISANVVYEVYYRVPLLGCCCYHRLEVPLCMACQKPHGVRRMTTRRRKMTNRTYLVVASISTIIQSIAPFQILWHIIISHYNPIYLLYKLSKRQYSPFLLTLSSNGLNFLKTIAVWDILYGTPARLLLSVLFRSWYQVESR